MNNDEVKMVMADGVDYATREGYIDAEEIEDEELRDLYDMVQDAYGEYALAIERFQYYLESM